MKLFKLSAILFMCVVSISLSGQIVGNSGNCITNGDPNDVATLVSQDLRYNCSSVLDTSTNNWYTYFDENPAGEKWVSDLDQYVWTEDSLVHLILMYGQSNAVGRAEIQAGSNEDEGNSAVKIWNSTSFVDMPAALSVTQNPDGVATQHGLEKTLNLYQKSFPSTHLYVVKSADGAEPIIDLSAGGPEGHYRQFIDRSTEAIQWLLDNGYEVSVTLFWSQGESDSNDPDDTVVYQERFRDFAKSVRQVFGQDLPIICLELAENQATRIPINDQLGDAQISDIGIIPAGDLPRKDNVHYTSEAFREIAKRFIAVMGGRSWQGSVVNRNPRTTQTRNYDVVNKGEFSAIKSATHDITMEFSFEKRLENDTVWVRHSNDPIVGDIGFYFAFTTSRITLKRVNSNGAVSSYPTTLRAHTVGDTLTYRLSITDSVRYGQVVGGVYTEDLSVLVNQSVDQGSVYPRIEIFDVEVTTDLIQDLYEPAIFPDRLIIDGKEFDLGEVKIWTETNSRGAEYLKNIGIGTTANGDYKLRVYQDEAAGTDDEITRWETVSGGILGLLVSDLAVGSPEWTFRAGSNESISFKDGSLENFRIGSNGELRVEQYTGLNFLNNSEYALTVDTTTGEIGKRLFTVNTDDWENNANGINYSLGNVSIGLPANNDYKLRIYEDEVVGTDSEITRWQTASGGILGLIVDDLSLGVPQWTFRSGTNEAISFHDGPEENLRVAGDGRIYLPQYGGASFLNTLDDVLTIDVTTGQVGRRDISTIFQDLSLTGNILSLTDDATTVDLDKYDIWSKNTTGAYYDGGEPVAIGALPNATYQLRVHEIDVVGSDSEVQRWSSASGGVMGLLIDDLSVANPSWKFRTGSNEAISFYDGGVMNMNIAGTGQISIPRYIGTNFDGTIAKHLGVDASGNVVKNTLTIDGIDDVLSQAQSLTATRNIDINSNVLHIMDGATTMLSIKPNVGHDGGNVTIDANRVFYPLQSAGDPLPAGTGDGGLYYNTTDDQLKFSDGTDWVGLPSDLQGVLNQGGAISAGTYSYSAAGATISMFGTGAKILVPDLQSTNELLARRLRFDSDVVLGTCDATTYGNVRQQLNELYYCNATKWVPLSDKGAKARGDISTNTGQTTAVQPIPLTDGYKTAGGSLDFDVNGYDASVAGEVTVNATVKIENNGALGLYSLCIYKDGVRQTAFMSEELATTEVKVLNSFWTGDVAANETITCGICVVPGTSDYDIVNGSLNIDFNRL